MLRRSLVYGGWRFYSLIALRSRLLRSLLWLIGLSLTVAFIAGSYTLWHTHEQAVIQQAVQSSGTHFYAANLPDEAIITTSVQERIETDRDTRFMVPLLHHRHPSDNGMDVIGVGPVPPGESAYHLTAGRPPGPGEAVLKQGHAARLGLKLGDSFTIELVGADVPVALVGLRSDTNAIHGEERESALVNLSWLQQQLGRPGQATALLLGGHELFIYNYLVANVARVVHPQLLLTPNQELIDSYWSVANTSTFADGLGYMALVIAFFLIRGTAVTAVQDRTRELAVLRAVGASDRQVYFWVIIESLLMGIVAVLLGIGLGVGFAGLLQSTTARLNDLPTVALAVPWAKVLFAGTGGLVLVLLSVGRPARAAAEVPPLLALRPEREETGTTPRIGSTLALVGLMICGLLVGCSYLLAPGALRTGIAIPAGFGFLACMVLSLGRLIPLLSGWMARPLSLLFPAAAPLAARRIATSHERTKLMAAIVCLGSSFVLVLGTLFSFAGASELAHIDNRFLMDAKISVSQGQQAGLSDELVERISSVNEIPLMIAMTDRTWSRTVRFDFSGADPDWVRQRMAEYPPMDDDTPLKLFYYWGVDLTALIQVADFGEVEGDLTQPGAVFTRLMARQRGITLGQEIEFLSIEERDSPAGHRDPESVVDKATVVAIVEYLPAYFVPYRQGFENTFLVSRELVPRAPVHEVHFSYLPELRQQVLQQLTSLPGMHRAELVDRAVQRNKWLQYGRQMWTLQFTLIFLSGVMIAGSLINTVLTALHQRRQELAMLRAIGAGPGQNLGHVLLELLLVVMPATVLAGLNAVAFVTAFVSMKAADMDSLVVEFPVSFYLACLTAPMLLALLTGAWPGWRVSRRPVAEALH